MILLMRMRRMKVPEGADGIYHCHSRAVDGRNIFDARGKEEFLRRMWRTAEFLGVQILSYTVMSNHYHHLVLVPGEVELTNEELLERLRVYYGERNSNYLEFREALDKGDETLDQLREQHMRRMGDVSEFEKTLKQGFSSWYNRRNDRRGTLWMEPFGSTIAEDDPIATIPMAAYIDLNPVRAGIVDDPKDYLHCGYAAALAGDERCREGIQRLMHMNSWPQASTQYRIYLMQQGQMKVPGKAGTIDRDLLLKTLKEEGHLPAHQLLRLKVRYFTHGLVLGSEKYVEEFFQQYRSHFGERRKTGARPIKALPESGLHVLRDLRKTVFS